MDFLIPSRADRPGNDPIFTLNAEATARAAKGESIVNATIGVLLDDDGKLALMDGVAEALRDTPASVGAGYAPIAGSPEFLRGVVADVLGQRPAAEWTAAVATPGGSGAVRLAIADFLEPQQTALTTSYYWAPYRTFTDEVDRGLATFRMFDERGRLDTVDLERKLQATVESQGRGMLILNSPCHNPTGYSFDEEEWARVVEVVDRVGAAPGRERAPITVVLDVAYTHYSASGLDSCLDQVLQLAGKAMILVTWSASKAFTQYGLRVGALLAIHPDAEQRRRIQNALNYSCRGTWSNCNAGGMAAIARALTDPALRVRTENERAALKALLDRRVARWNELASTRKLRYPRYNGGFFITVFCEDAQAAAARLQQDGVFVVPISAGALRVALCAVAERDIPRLVDTIARHVAS
ncbi:aminotransferase [Sorangium cellulosum]|uniref:Aminotransferase n=1 Tax=Sorangium cellulosum TaxID=56 RepID=A0A2L0FAG7_SORCE|nr:aminotransferase class I/II-fold pyridoxal phosphate-dependent enzyme [Sorangium cellulosum]AUX48596.1 aminotransferase [Sorangium cellulosum]